MDIPIQLTTMKTKRDTFRNQLKMPVLSLSQMKEQLQILIFMELMKGKYFLPLTLTLEVDRYLHLEHKCSYIISKKSKSMSFYRHLWSRTLKREISIMHR